MKMGTTLTCEVCGKKFTKTHQYEKYCCDECRKVAQKEYFKRYEEKRRAKKTQPNKAPKETLDKILKQLDRYNKKNNTCLSYGQFVEMKRREKEIKERAKKKGEKVCS